MQFAETSGRRRLKPLIPVAALSCACLAFLMASPPGGSTHEPITTQVMFNKEIVRIFQRQCLDCHSEGRLMHDIPLATYEQARPWAKAIKEEVLEKRMPPFQAVKGFGNFRHDYLLPQREIDLIVSWVEGGAPKGDEKSLPRVKPDDEWPLGPPDLILRPETVAKIPARGEEETRCFAIPTGLSGDRFLAAVDYRPGSPRVVHSAAVVVDHPAPAGLVSVAAQQAATCDLNGGDAVGDRMLNWAPGPAAARLPAGAAYRLPAGGRVLLKVRYRPSGEAATDRGEVAIYFAKEASSRPVRGVAIKPPMTQVPAGATRYCVKASYVTPQAAEALAIRPLLFPLATSVEARAYRPDGTVEVLIWARNYRFDWQPAYTFKQPVALPKGTRVEVAAYLDNSDDNPNNPSDPPQALRISSALCELYFTEK